MAKFLAIETATDVCSVCISEDAQVLSEYTLTDGRRHSKELTSQIQSCLAQAELSLVDIDAVVVSDGPGSYTGLRVGASTVKGICMAQEKPLIVVPTLQALAGEHGGTVMATIDARRMEVYAAIYEDGRLLQDVHSYIWSAESCAALTQQYDELIICGDGAAKAVELCKPYDNILITSTICRASLLLPVAINKYSSQEFADLAYYSPNYFKSPKIGVSKKPTFKKF